MLYFITIRIAESAKAPGWGQRLLAVPRVLRGVIDIPVSQHSAYATQLLEARDQDNEPLHEYLSERDKGTLQKAKNDFVFFNHKLDHALPVVHAERSNRYWTNSISVTMRRIDVPRTKASLLPMPKKKTDVLKPVAV